MPFAIDEDRMNMDPLKAKPGVPTLVSLDPAKPPVKQIPHMEFPRLVYKHPKEPFKKIEHRNTQHELVHTEVIPSEHIYRSVADARELAQALKEGWVKEPYVQQGPPDPNADLYESK